VVFVAVYVKNLRFRYYYIPQPMSNYYGNGKVSIPMAIRNLSLYNAQNSLMAGNSVQCIPVICEVKFDPFTNEGFSAFVPFVSLQGRNRAVGNRHVWYWIDNVNFGYE
jgi:hypothetical protein